MGKRKIKCCDSEDSDAEEAPLSKEKVNVTVLGTHIYFYDKISLNSTFALHVLIRKCLDKQSKHHKRLTIHLISRGGDVECSLATYDLLRGLKDVHVTVIVEGPCCSSGTFILLAADRRVMRKRASIMIHNLSGEVTGTLEQCRDSLKNYESVTNLMLSVYREKTSLGEKELDYLMRRDLHFGAAKAKELGFIDKVE